MGEAPLLDIRGLSITTAAGAPVLRDVHLHLRRGEVLGLVGESGSGKTTLGLAALGHVRAGLARAAGRVWFDGEELFGIPPAQLAGVRAARMAYVAQSAQTAFNPAHRLTNQIIEAAVFHGLMDEKTARARALADQARLGLPEPEKLGRRYPHQVSGGQLQRVMTAMAMQTRPGLIVFDEPTTALDVTTQARVLLAMKRLLAQSGAAALFITHDLAVVAQMAQRICILHKGCIVEENATEAILAHPAHPVTRNLWAVRQAQRTARAGGKTLLEARNLTAGYGRGKDILHDVCLRIASGRTVAVVGESGSGKTTLGRVICGLLEPRSGTMRLDGAPLPGPLRQRGKSLRRRIRFVHQSAETALNPAHRVRDILARPLRLFEALRGAALAARIEGLMRMVELDPALLPRRTGQLSGGQKQRLALARALAGGPDLVICDEVTSSLDKVIQREILGLLARLQEETGVSYLFITHDMDTVRAIADEVIVMAGGRIVEQGLRDAVLDTPQSEHTKRLLACAPRPQPGWLETAASTAQEQER